MAEVRRDLRRTGRTSANVLVALSVWTGALRTAGETVARRQWTKDRFELTTDASVFIRHRERRLSRRLKVRDQPQHVASSLRVTTEKPVSVFDQVDRTFELRPRTVLDLSRLGIESQQTAGRHQRPEYSI